MRISILGSYANTSSTQQKLPNVANILKEVNNPPSPPNKIQARQPPPPHIKFRDIILYREHGSQAMLELVSNQRFTTTGSIELNLLFAPRISIHQRIWPNIRPALAVGRGQPYLQANGLIVAEIGRDFPQRC